MEDDYLNSLLFANFDRWGDWYDNGDNWCFYCQFNILAEEGTCIRYAGLNEDKELNMFFTS